MFIMLCIAAKYGNGLAQDFHLFPFMRCIRIYICTCNPDIIQFLYCRIITQQRIIVKKSFKRMTAYTTAFVLLSGSGCKSK